MANKGKFLSLILVVLMMMAAAITVNKTIFGHSLEKTSPKEEQSITESDEVTVLPDGNVIIHTKGMPKTVDGYAGPVPLDIYITDGKISEVKALPNAETPSFFKRASQLLSEWNGKTPSEALEMRVDAVSGATYSSDAIMSNVYAGLAHYQKVSGKPASNTPWKIWVALAVTLAACIAWFIHARIRKTQN